MSYVELNFEVCFNTFENVPYDIMDKKGLKGCTSAFDRSLMISESDVFNYIESLSIFFFHTQNVQYEKTSLSVWNSPKGTKANNIISCFRSTVVYPYDATVIYKK